MLYLIFAVEMKPVASGENSTGAHTKVYKKYINIDGRYGQAL